MNWDLFWWNAENNMYTKNTERKIRIALGFSDREKYVEVTNDTNYDWLLYRTAKAMNKRRPHTFDYTDDPLCILVEISIFYDVVFCVCVYAST